MNSLPGKPLASLEKKKKVCESANWVREGVTCGVWPRETCSTPQQPHAHTHTSTHSHLGLNKRRKPPVLLGIDGIVLDGSALHQLGLEGGRLVLKGHRDDVELLHQPQQRQDVWVAADADVSVKLSQHHGLAVPPQAVILYPVHQHVFLVPFVDHHTLQERRA